MENEAFKTDLLNECKVLRAANTKATAAERGLIAYSILKHYTSPSFDEKTLELIADDWVEDLEFIEFENGEKFYLSVDLLKLAASRWRKNANNSFRPMVGQVLALIKKEAFERMACAKRAEQIIEALGLDHIKPLVIENKQNLGD